MDTKKLRQKILDLAIHGKLVPQDPSDEPASVLLERIRAEKEALIKEGKIKRAKKATASDTSHYENVPEGWVLTDIGELLTNRDSERVPLSLGVRSKQQNKIYDYYGATGVVDKVDGYLFDERLLLIGEDGANLLSRSKDNAFFAEGKYWVNNHAHILDCPEKEVLDYVAFLINSMSLEDYITGSAQPKLNQDNLNKIEIPLPPLEEQRRIIAQVNLWQSFIQHLEAHETELKDSVESAKSKILDLAIHGKLVPQDPSDEPASELLKRINPKAATSCDNPHYENIPSNWVCTTIGSIFQHNTGKALNKSTSEEGTLLPYLTTSNVYWNSFDLSVIKEMRFKDSEMDKCTVQKGDLLVCEGGDIGRSAIWDNDYSVCIQNHLHRLRPKGDVIPLLYMYYIMHLKLTNHIEGKGIGLQGLSSGMLDKLEIPLPPYNEQKRIVDKIQETFDILDSITESLSLS